MTSLFDLTAAAYIDPTVQLYGRVSLGEGSSVWCNAGMRSEAAHIAIGAFTNIQDFVMVHTDPGRPVVVVSHCSITHHATLHGCTIGNNVLIGINATVYGGAVIGDNSIVGQHAYVRDGTVVPPNSVVVGAPAKVIRTANNWIANRLNALSITATPSPMPPVITAPGTGPSSRIGRQRRWRLFRRSSRRYSRRHEPAPPRFRRTRVRSPRP